MNAKHHHHMRPPMMRNESGQMCSLEREVEAEQERDSETITRNETSCSAFSLVYPTHLI